MERKLWHSSYPEDIGMFFGHSGNFLTVVVVSPYVALI